MRHWRRTDLVIHLGRPSLVHYFVVAAPRMGMGHTASGRLITAQHTLILAESAEREAGSAPVAELAGQGWEDGTDHPRRALQRSVRMRIPSVSIRPPDRVRE